MIRKHRVDICFNGEFGSELQIVVPYAYYLCKKNLLGKTVSSMDTRCLYYFSRNHEEKYKVRRYCSPDDSMSRCLPNKTEHKFRLNTSKYIPPPYKEQYSNCRFVWEKEPLVILNKFNIEWEIGPINYISLPVLKNIFELLCDRYQVIYCRPTENNIIPDHNTIQNLGDFELLTNYPQVLTIQKLKKDNPDLSFNTLQFMVFANCNKFISVQGGNSVLASYFAETNIIYAQRGKELTKGDFNNYTLFRKSRICPCLNYHDLLSCIKKLYFNRTRTRFDKNQQDSIISIQRLKYNARVFKSIFDRIGNFITYPLKRRS